MPSAPHPVIDEMFQAMRAQDTPRFRELGGQALQTARGLGPDELTAGITDLAPLLGRVAGVFSKIAVLAGTLVEWGGSPLPLCAVLPGRAAIAMKFYQLFPQAWQDASGGRPLPPRDGDQPLIDEAIDIVVAEAERRGLDPVPRVPARCVVVRCR
jgi:hypothetical protein